MKMKNVLVLLLAAMMLFSMVGCGGSKAPAPAPIASPVADPTAEPVTEPSSEPDEQPESEPVLVGFSMHTLSDANMQIIQKVQNEYVTELEAEYGTDIEIVYTDAGNSLDKQISDVESLISMGCGAISIKAVDTASIDPAFAAIQEAGIKSMDSFFGSQSDHLDAQMLFLDNYLLGVMQANWIIEYLEANPDVNLKVGYLDGMSGVPKTLERCVGFKDTVVEHFGADSERIQILAEQVSENNTETALAIAEDWIQTFPEINCYIGFTDDVIMSAVNAYKAAGKYDDSMVFVGVDAVTWIQSIADGDIDASIRMDFNNIAKEELRMLVNLAMGKSVEGLGQPSLNNFAVVDASNVDEWM